VPFNLFTHRRSRVPAHAMSIVSSPQRPSSNRSPPGASPAIRPTTLEFRCAACATLLDFANAPTIPPNATLDESFVLLAPELASREKRERSIALAASSDARATLRDTQFGDSFVVLSRRRASDEGVDIKASTLSRIFDIASDLSDVDHPMCETCANAALSEVRKRTAEAERECEAYEETLERLREAEAGIDARVTSAENGITHAMADLELAEREAEETIRLLEAELEATRQARSKLAKKAAALNEAEQTYWHEFHAFKKNLNAHLEKRESILARIDQAQTHIARLEKTNVFNDAFHIWTDGAFGTINGFRLGRLPNTVVEWDEINAAFGLACLLLHSMARICKFTFTQYTLQPLGSFPKVRDDKGNVYELFGPTLIISSYKYDKAIVGFLTCLSELAEFMRARDIRQQVNPPFELPYPISGDKVDGKKMSFTFNSDENWTYALKLALTDLKLMLAWLSHKD